MPLIQSLWIPDHYLSLKVSNTVKHSLLWSQKKIFNKETDTVSDEKDQVSIAVHKRCSFPF